MAGEIAFDYKNGASCYAQIRNRTSGYIWNGAAFMAYSQLSGDVASYPVGVSEQGASAHYVGNFPSAIGPGVYDVTIKELKQLFYAESDPVVAGGEIQWNGTIAVPLANLCTSGQFGQIGPIRVARGTMVKPFLIYLKSSLDHITPFTSGIVSGMVSKDGSVFGPLQSGAFTEVGQGFYSLEALTSGDTLGNAIGLLFNAVGVSGGASDPLPLSILTQRVSGQ